MEIPQSIVSPLFSGSPGWPSLFNNRPICQVGNQVPISHVVHMAKVELPLSFGNPQGGSYQGKMNYHFIFF